ncbi:TetR/AcrR family transcriptional regulator [Undibacterium sp. SXout7W]|uniref:TetR/AcrR family transcriptional regulator n=1 Tax=Undibacterium sp. SXout7W TaxID=3413049 RepID=UPI003BF06362
MNKTELTNTCHQDTRERILAIGQQLILSRGFSAIGLSEILTAAEVPKGSFYHYFQSKEGFGVAMLERYFSLYCEQSKSLFEHDALSARERLLTYFRQWQKAAAHSNCYGTCLAVKLAAEVADLSEPMRLALSHGMSRITLQIADLIRQGQQEQSIATTIEPQTLAESLYGMWVGASLLSKVNRDLRSMDLAYRQTEMMLLI